MSWCGGIGKVLLIAGSCIWLFALESAFAQPSGPREKPDTVQPPSGSGQDSQSGTQEKLVVVPRFRVWIENRTTVEIHSLLGPKETFPVEHTFPPFPKGYFWDNCQREYQIWINTANKITQKELACGETYHIYYDANNKTYDVTNEGIAQNIAPATKDVAWLDLKQLGVDQGGSKHGAITLGKSAAITELAPGQFLVWDPKEIRATKIPGVYKYGSPDDSGTEENITSRSSILALSPSKFLFFDIKGLKSTGVEGVFGYGNDADKGLWVTESGFFNWKNVNPRKTVPLGVNSAATELKEGKIAVFNADPDLTRSWATGAWAGDRGTGAQAQDIIVCTSSFFSTCQ